jgi:hypothetical protein
MGLGEISMNESSEPKNSSDSESALIDRRQQAILRCTREALSSAQQALENKHLDLKRLISNYMGGYCRYLPEICDYESTRDFIACVVYGMAIEAVCLDRGTKLLYGAQIALSAFRPPTKAKK